MKDENKNVFTNQHKKYFLLMEKYFFQKNKRMKKRKTEIIIAENYFIKTVFLI